MPNRFPDLAPQEKPSRPSIARALPAPAIRWLDVVIFGLVVVLIRLF